MADHLDTARALPDVVIGPRLVSGHSGIGARITPESASG